MYAYPHATHTSPQARSATLSRQLETERQQASAVSNALRDEIQGLKVRGYRIQ